MFDKDRPGALQQHLARLWITAVPNCIHERPQFSGGLGECRFAAKQSGADTEEYPPSQLHSFDLRNSPGKGIKQGKPRVFELGQISAADRPTQKLTCYDLQPRFSGNSVRLVQLLEPLAPPSEADRP